MIQVQTELKLLTIQAQEELSVLKSLEAQKEDTLAVGDIIIISVKDAIPKG